MPILMTPWCCHWYRSDWYIQDAQEKQTLLFADQTRASTSKKKRQKRDYPLDSTASVCWEIPWTQLIYYRSLTCILLYFSLLWIRKWLCSSTWSEHVYPAKEMKLILTLVAHSLLLFPTAATGLALFSEQLQHTKCTERPSPLTSNLTFPPI